MEGLGYGLSAMVGGVFSGLSDLIIKPVEGAQKESVLGLGKGILKGIGGALIKPISGVFDFVSKTTEGIKNGVNDNIVISRVREPRCFYGIFKIIKKYDYNAACVLKFINNEIQEFKDNEFVYFDSIMYKNKNNELILLVFVSSCICVIDFVKKQLISVIAYSDVKYVDLKGTDVIKIYFNKRINNVLSTKIQLSNEIKNQKKIYYKIKNAIHSNNWIKYKK